MISQVKWRVWTTGWRMSFLQVFIWKKIVNCTFHPAEQHPSSRYFWFVHLIKLTCCSLRWKEKQPCVPIFLPSSAFYNHLASITMVTDRLVHSSRYCIVELSVSGLVSSVVRNNQQESKHQLCFCSYSDYTPFVAPVTKQLARWAWFALHLKQRISQTHRSNLAARSAKPYDQCKQIKTVSEPRTKMMSKISELAQCDIQYYWLCVKLWVILFFIFCLCWGLWLPVV